jgi:hypothetical protein
MGADDAFRQKFSKDVSHGFDARMAEQGLVLGGALLAKMGDDGLCIEGSEERIFTLLAIAYGRDVPEAMLGSLRRVSKHWRGGNKCLAAIYLAQSGLGKLDTASAYRLSLAAKLIDAGVTPRELARDLGFVLPADLIKYSPDQPRVPAGSGRESGQWTSRDAAAGGDASSLVEGRSAGANAAEIYRVRELPKDAIVVTRPDGTTIDDPSSPTKKLMAPPRANFQEVYAAGEKIANWPKAEQIEEAKAALEQFGTYDFQRDQATNTHFKYYVNASTYAIGVYMAGAGYGRWFSIKIAQTYGFFFSSTKYDPNAEAWAYKGWDDAHNGDWR